MSGSQFFYSLAKIFRQTFQAIATSSPEPVNADLRHHQILGSEVLLLMQQFSEISSRESSPTEQLEAIAQLLQQSLDFAYVLLESYDAAQDQCQLQCVAGTLPIGMELPSPPSEPSALGRSVIESQRPCVKTEAEQIYLPQLQHTVAAFVPFTTVVCIPLVLRKKVMGVMTLAHPQSIPVPDYFLSWLTSLVPAIAEQLEYQTLEGQLQATQQQLAEASVAPYHQLLNSLQDVVFQADPEGRWTFLNPAWERLTGFSVENSLGKSWSEFVFPEDEEAHQQLFWRLLSENTALFPAEVRYRTQEGGIRWVEIHSQILRGAEGNILGLSGSLIDITTRKSVEARMEHNALHDALTGLPNRTLFMDRLQHSYQNHRRQRDEGFALLFIDLDRFKMVNDSLGHLAGDELLKVIAERLSSCLRPGDTASRMGGDEFTVLLPAVSHIQDVIQVSDRILQQLNQPLMLNGNEIFPSCSIGIALSDNPDQSPEELLGNADRALYRAKDLGKGRYELFSAKMHTPTLAQLELETDLRWALERQEFSVVYQPIYRLPERQLSGFEAILQWEHPSKGLLTSSEFLPIAEETGLLGDLSWWLLKKACQQLHEWHQQHPSSSPLWMAVNLSAQAVGATNFHERIHQLLTETEVSAMNLVLEVNETVFVHDMDGTIAKLKELQDEGVRICLDEFGRRFSSLGDLGRLPLDRFKIDHGFIHEMELGNTLDIIRSMVDLGHRLGLQVVADGLEDDLQVVQVQSMRCHYGQGSFFAQPATAQTFNALLEQNVLFDALNMGTASSIAPTLVIRTPSSYSQIPLAGRAAWSIGRSGDCHIVLPDRWVSRNHAEIQVLQDKDYYLVDLGSGNGSFVNGQRVTMPVELKDGDLLTIGRTELEFQFLHTDADRSPRLQESTSRSVLLMQASSVQTDIWREVLASQGIALTVLNLETDLRENIEQRAHNHEPLPDLLLLDMTVLRPNPYSFCRWCHNHYPQLKIVLTSGTRTEVPQSERQWAIHQGAVDLLSAFPEDRLFSNFLNITTKVSTVLKILNWPAVSQQSLTNVLSTMRQATSKGTLIQGSTSLNL